MKTQKQYVVYITRYSGTKLPNWYIGSSYEQKVLNGYNGTVLSKKYKKIYNDEQKHNKHLFKTKILSYHSSPEKALEEELRLQKAHFVVSNNNYFNESYAQPNGFFGRDVSGKNNPMYGTSRTGEQNPFYGKTHSKETMGNRKQSNLEKYGVENTSQLDEVKRKISQSKKGKKFPSKTCPHCSKIGSGPNMTRYHFDNCKLKT